MSKFEKKTAVGLLVCATVVILWFSPWWICGRNLAPLDVLNRMMQPWRATSEQVSVKNHIVSDAVDQYLIYRMVAAESYRKEGWLGWSSLTYGGTAQYANTMALYYDWTMQLHRWFDFWTAWHLGLMGQVMLAAAGMLLFLRGRSIGVVWSCCGALAYAANSQFVTWIYHRWALSAFCWVPWILWAADRYRRGNPSCWALVPIFMALAFLGGTLQYAAYVILAVMALWAEEAVGKGRSLSAQTQLAGRYAAWGLLGTGMATMMFLPCTDAFLTSTKLGLHMGMHGNSAMGVYPRGPLQPLLNLAAYPLQIFPSIVGRSESLDLLKFFKSELFYVAYFGSLAGVIAFIALFRKSSPLLSRILIGIGLLLPLTPVLRHLYQRLYLLFILGGIFAFVHFMETASAETRKRLFKITGAAAAVAIAAWTALSVGLWLKAETVHALFQRKLVKASGGSFGYFREWIQARADKFQGDLLIWSPQQFIPLALFLATLAGFRMCAATDAARRKQGAILVAAAVVLEVTVFAARWVVFVNPAECPLYPVTPEVTALREHVRDGRTTTIIEETGFHMAVTPFIPNTLSAYGISTIHGYDSIMPDGMFLITDQRRDADTLGRLGVSHLITFPNNPAVGNDWKSIWKSSSMELFENPVPFPRYAGFADDAAKDQFFHKGPTHSIPLTETTGRENIRKLRVPAGVRWIRVAENQADGWQYRTSADSPWWPILRAPDATMLLDMAGIHQPKTVEMRYDPPMKKWGVRLSVAFLCLLFPAQFLAARRGSLQSLANTN